MIPTHSRRVGDSTRQTATTKGLHRATAEQATRVGRAGGTAPGHTDGRSDALAVPERKPRLADETVSNRAIEIIQTPLTR